MPEILNLAGRLRATRAELFEALQPEELSNSHRFVLQEIMAHIEELEARMARFEHALLQGLTRWQAQLVLLQTLPGIDRMGAAMLLVEISADMDSFGSAEKLASWVGICPGNNESAGKRKSGKTRVTTDQKADGNTAAASAVGNAAPRLSPYASALGVRHFGSF